MAISSSDQQLDAVFHALADPTRRSILAMLAKGEKTAGEVGRPFKISQPAASKHIRVLEQAGLVVRAVDGRFHRLALDGKPLAAAERWLSRHREFWQKSLDSLGSMLADMQKAKH